MIELMAHWQFFDDEMAPKSPSKAEVVEDPLEDKYGPLKKRSKLSSAAFQQRGAGGNADAALSLLSSPIDEPGPLGLQLRKSPSLLDLIQMSLSQGSASATTFNQQTQEGASATSIAQQSKSHQNDYKGSSASSVTEKLKASNFSASVLRIGSWEYKSRYEGDLVAKYYFAKHKLVWEILQDGLKSKLEIQWSDVMDLKAICPDDVLGTLIVTLARPPVFFKETNPQPRKHTLWQATTDFTNGQASIHRTHFLQCPLGQLNKHFEKLIQSDMRLKFLSQQPDLYLVSPYFEQQTSVFENLDRPNSRNVNRLETAKGSSSSRFLDRSSQSAAQSSSLDREETAGASDHVSMEAYSPSSGSGGHCEVVSKRRNNSDQFKVPGLHPSMSVSDLMNRIGNCISEQMTSGKESFPVDDADRQNMLKDISQYLFSDTQLASPSDEKSVMARVNSLCCLLQKEPASNQAIHVKRESCIQVSDSEKFVQQREGNTHDLQFSGQIPGMPRNDSLGELLLQLPRIASLPQFFFNVPNDDNRL